MNFVQMAEFDWLPWQHKVKFLKNYSKILFSEAIRGMKLKLSIDVHDISLCIYYVFLIIIARVVSLLWQLKVSIDL